MGTFFGLFRRRYLVKKGWVFKEQFISEKKKQFITASINTFLCKEKNIFSKADFLIVE
jgi:hypothetical protein